MFKKLSVAVCAALCCCTVFAGGKEILRNSGFYERGINNRPVPRWWHVSSGNSSAVDVVVKREKGQHIIHLDIPGKSAILSTHFYRIPCSQLSAGKPYLLKVSGSGKAEMQLKLYTYNAQGKFIRTVDVKNFSFDNGGTLLIENLAGYVAHAVRFAPAIFISADKCVLTGVSIQERESTAAGK